MEALILFSSTFITGLLAYFFFKKEAKSFTKLLLSFSGAFLLGTCVLHLMPEVFGHSGHFHDLGIFILVGFLIQILLEYFSGGSEHGHIHSHGDKFPIGMFIGLCIHSFWEGTPFSHHHGHDHSHDHLLTGIILHKIPVTIVLATFLKKAKIKTVYALLFLGIFAVSPAIGSAVASMDWVTHDIHTASVAIVLGMMLHISTTILYESSEDHRFNIYKLTSILIGFGLCILLF